MIELLGFQYTDRCNAECAHCCVSSGPRRQTKMDPEFAAQIIGQAAALGIPAIKFTGGEALLYPQEILELTGLARRKGMSVGVVTNGYWAPTVEKGVRFLTPLIEAGLREVDISVDQWHWAFLKPEQVGRAIQAARAFRDVKVVLYRVMKVSETAEDPAFYAALGLTPDDLTFESCNANDMIRQSRRDPAGRLLVRWTWVSRVGRGANLPAEDAPHAPCASIAPLACGEVTRAPVIYPDGTLFACCSGLVPSPLHAGNLRQTSLSLVQDGMKRNSLLQLIANRGPAHLRDALRQRHLDGDLPLTCDSICDLCKGILSRVEEPILQDVATEELLKILLFGLIPQGVEAC
jgi:hypothetical protein